MKILVINSGSSSLKSQYFIDKKTIASITIENIKKESSRATIKYRDKSTTKETTISNHKEALDILFSLLKEFKVIIDIDELDSIGHRVVHGGEEFCRSVLIDDRVIKSIESISHLAPLHNPINLKAIKIIKDSYPHIPQVAVFDTAFHHTIPKYASLYPISYTLSRELSIKRYGFHGTSHHYIAKEAAKLLKRDLNTLNLITLHLGNGASICAIKDGESIDTSMGFTPLEGLMMGERCGDIDSAIIPYLIENGRDIKDIYIDLNSSSGLKGICGTNDMRDIIRLIQEGDEMARVALEMYTYKIKKYIGAYVVALGRVDGIIFTAGVGENTPIFGEMVCDGLEKSVGRKREKESNLATQSGAIHHSTSKIPIFVIPTNEELEIAIETKRVSRG